MLVSSPSGPPVSTQTSISIARPAERAAGQHSAKSWSNPKSFFASDIPISSRGRGSDGSWIAVAWTVSCWSENPGPARVRSTKSDPKHAATFEAVRPIASRLANEPESRPRSHDDRSSDRVLRDVYAADRAGVAAMHLDLPRLTGSGCRIRNGRRLGRGAPLRRRVVNSRFRRCPAPARAIGGCLFQAVDEPRCLRRHRGVDAGRGAGLR